MSGITFGSVCSGIEAASVAWHPLGWRAAWLAEIEPFPCALLAHHYPDVPNLGNMLAIPRMLRNGDIAPPDVFTGGTPCQAFSLAGLRNSLDDARGNLSLTFCEIANEIDIQRAARGLLPATVIWENVPGVLSTKDNAFGYFLAGLAGEDDPLVAPGKKWADAGCVLGPQRAVAWRILDAQYFGLAQRRRRVFIIASARPGFDPARVLFEFEGVRRDSAPRRGQGQDAAAGTLRSTDGGSDLDHACAGHLQPVVSTLDASYGRLQGCSGQDANHGHSHLVPLAFGGNNQSGPIDVATARNACGSGSGRLDFESETFVVQPAVAFSCKDYGADASVELAPTMRAMGHSGSHANAGGQLAVCIAGDITQLHGEGNGELVNGTRQGEDNLPTWTVRDLREAGRGGTPQERGLARPLAEQSATALPGLPHQGAQVWQEVHAVRQPAQGAGVLHHALPAIQDMGRSADCEGQPVHRGAEGFGEQPDQAVQGGGVRVKDACEGILREARPAGQPGNAWDQQHQQGRGNAKGMGNPPYAVRRLLPVECEKLQGFWPGYTQIPVRGKPAADGPRYKALGNSWAVPVVRWIGGRVDQHLRDLDARG
jgi:DNA (cytosine-5)-methyltransferase 1